MSENERLSKALEESVTFPAEITATVKFEYDPADRENNVDSEYRILKVYLGNFDYTELLTEDDREYIIADLENQLEEDAYDAMITGEA